MITISRTEVVMVQFNDQDGGLVTTPVSGLSLVRSKNHNWAFYGTKGRAELTDDEFKAVHDRLDFSVPDAQKNISVVGDDDDFTTP